MKTKFCDYIKQIKESDKTCSFVRKDVETLNFIRKITDEKVFALEIGLNGKWEEVEWDINDADRICPIFIKEIINDKYFLGLIELPNLKFGKNSFTKLGSYSYASDTITISSALKHDFELLDYVMHHELLHKKHQFNSKNGRSYHHTALFRKKEKEFENAGLMEKRLGRLRLKNFFRLF